VPAAGANGRGLLEAGVAPGYGPGYSPLLDTAGEGEEHPGDANRGPRGVHAIGTGLASGELNALYLLHADPLRSTLAHDVWSDVLGKAGAVIAHASFLTEGLREHADVVFPAESYAEKEGTVVHPDGRLQRLRPAIARQGDTRPEWSVLAELARRCGLGLEVASGPMASQRLFDAVPFYAGLTLEEIGGRGVRWQERPQAAAYSDGHTPSSGGRHQPPAGVGADGGPPGNGGPPLQVVYSNGDTDALAESGGGSIWAAPEVEFSPALKFLYRRWGLGIPARGVSSPSAAGIGGPGAAGADDGEGH
jgi:NADH-quinone oxidoreductase subunit G